MMVRLNKSIPVHRSEKVKRGGAPVPGGGLRCRSRGRGRRWRRDGPRTGRRSSAPSCPGRAGRTRSRRRRRSPGTSPVPSRTARPNCATSPLRNNNSNSDNNNNDNDNYETLPFSSKSRCVHNKRRLSTLTPPPKPPHCPQ